MGLTLYPNSMRLAICVGTVIYEAELGASAGLPIEPFRVATSVMAQLRWSVLACDAPAC